ncbi:MAG: hypothetical protein FD176_201 [Rhodospirillaceae bacterium]|nr:MAG: hypothetical protein FD176_201 [Rhodospirillaceae bacterium]TNC98719.1 MAG: hypothetical protein FD119_190 [Stygiobacter sp.]
MSHISQDIGRQLVEELGPDCATASAVAATLRAKDGLRLPIDRFVGNGVARSDMGIVHRVLERFALHDWCARDGDLWLSRGARMPEWVPPFLSGAAAMRRYGRPESTVEAVVTLPVQPSKIEEKLPAHGIAYVRLVETDNAFLKIAEKAVQRLTVMSPFLNEEGVEWVLGLFEATKAPERLLIVRQRRKIGHFLRQRADDFRRLQVRIIDYFVPLDRGYETFHCKVVMADEDVAYVGSANLLVYGRRSMELGVLTEGAVVKPIANLLRAVEAVSSNIGV